MARENLPAELIAAGGELLAATDALGMRAQAAMWLFDHELGDWRYYLVTSLVDSAGRRATYKRLIDIVAAGRFPRGMTLDDVHLASPTDDLFLGITSAVQGTDNRFEDCVINGIRIDGFMYRALRTLPTADEARQIDRDFARATRKLAAA